MIRIARWLLIAAAWAIAHSVPAKAPAAEPGTRPSPDPGAPPAADATRPSDRPLVLEQIVVEGADRTRRKTMLQAFALREGEAVTPEAILDAVADLRAVDLFAKVDFRTERGSERGRFRLVLIVEEKGLELRFGTGYRDLDGWYLIPAQLRLDNRLGFGEQLRLQANLGYRMVGLELLLADPHAAGGDLYWEAKLAGYGLDRPYFVDGVEYRHPVRRGMAGAHLGRRFGALRLQAGMRFETVDPDSTPEAARDDDVRGVERGDPLPFSSLPPEIAGFVGEDRRAVAHAELGVDTRSRRRVAGTPASGLWGRVRGEAVLREDGDDFGAVTADLRAYRTVHGGALALRVRGGIVDDRAGFYDRFHLGGLYTVRGFPSQSLSPAGGDTHFWTAALELRAPLTGPRADPRLLGVLFTDWGDGWREGEEDEVDVDASVGWGLRLRVPWFGSVGLDFGLPVGPSPVKESFHANFALGWNF